MSTDGILEYQGTKRVLYRGDTSNIVFDTRTTSLGIGVTGSNNPSSNLYITGNAYVSSNLAIGGVMTMGVVNVAARHNLQAVTDMGNVTTHTVEFTNPTTSIVASGNVEVAKELTVSGNTIVSSNLSVSGNVEVGTAKLFVDTVNSRVGVGTSDPLTPLHISSANEITTSPAGSAVSQMRYGSTNSTVLFGVSSTAGHISAYDTSNFSTNRNLCFNADGGNVGIGTANPVNQMLEIDGGGLYIQRSGTQSTSRNMDTNKWITLERSGNKVSGEGPGISFQGSYHQTADYNNYMAMIKARGFSDNDSRSRLEFLVNDGTGSSLSATDDVAGYFDYDSNGGQVNFTGQHRTFIKDFPFSQAWDLEGLIVSSDQNKYVKMDGGIEAGSNAITINEALPVVSLSTTANDKKCFGVISNAEDPENREDRYGRLCVRFKKEEGDTRFYINSVGEGGIWVTDVNGTLESGDYITTSNLVGYGQKQDDDFLHNYTVAKITMDCDFNPVTQPVQIIKRRLTDINYWIKTEYENISEDEYLYITEKLASNLSNEKIRAITETKYTNKDMDITLEEYNTLEPGVKLEYKEETRVIYQRVIEEKFKTEKEGYEFEVRQELVNVLDEHGQIQWEDDPSDATEKAYKIRYLDADGNITDEANAVHKAAFVGCTYHCG
jgi:hypothetical protein